MIIVVTILGLFGCKYFTIASISGCLWLDRRNNRKGPKTYKKAESVDFDITSLYVEQSDDESDTTSNDTTESTGMDHRNCKYFLFELETPKEATTLDSDLNIESIDKQPFWAERLESYDIAQSSCKVGHEHLGEKESNSPN